MRRILDVNRDRRIFRVPRMRSERAPDHVPVRLVIFEKMGGFLPVALMEDVELARRLQKEAIVLVMDSTIKVSARRWERDGWIFRTMANVFLLLLYFLGVSPDRLARYYYSSHKQSGPIGNKKVKQ